MTTINPKERPKPPIAHKTRSYGIVARDAPTVVILRRGPTRHTRMLCWDLRDDTLRGGQWLIGTIDPRPCGVSPNGELLIYEARKGGRTFMALSRPPFFTALAFWEYSSPWTGGGFFADDQRLVLGLCFDDPYAGGTFPPGFEITDMWRYFYPNGRPKLFVGEVASKAPEAHHGWCTNEQEVLQKPNPARPALTLEQDRRGRYERAFTVVEKPRSPNAQTTSYDLGVLDWADWAHDGSLLFGREGLLYRQQISRSVKKPDPPQLVADLREQSFENIVAPPEMRRWPSKGTKSKRRR